LKKKSKPSRKLHSLTDREVSYMIRMAIACKSESRYPHNETGFVLFKVAAEAGIDVIRIDQEQEEKAIARNERMQTRVKELERRSRRCEGGPNSNSKKGSASCLFLNPGKLPPRLFFDLFGAAARQLGVL